MGMYEVPLYMSLLFWAMSQLPYVWYDVAVKSILNMLGGMQVQ